MNLTIPAEIVHDKNIFILFFSFVNISFLDDNEQLIIFKVLYLFCQ